MKFYLLNVRKHACRASYNEINTSLAPSFARETKGINDTLGCKDLTESSSSAFCMLTSADDTFLFSNGIASRTCGTYLFSSDASGQSISPSQTQLESIQAPYAQRNSSSPQILALFVCLCVCVCVLFLFFFFLRGARK